jgi:hypothetical protein
MTAQSKGMAPSGFDLLFLRDTELTAVLQSTVRQLASLQPSDEALIRFWGNIFALLDEERRRRNEEIAELHRLYFR